MSSIQKILVPVDFSDQSTPSVHHALQLAKTWHATVELLHVCELPITFHPAMRLTVGSEVLTIEEHLRAQATKAMADFVSGLPADGVRPTFRVKTGDAATVIVEAAEELGADLIVMGTAGRTGVMRLVLGSVAAKVSASAPCPVLTLSPRATEAESQSKAPAGATHRGDAEQPNAGAR